MINNLYVSGLRIDEEIPKDNYISKLPVVANLLKMGELRFDKRVTFFVGENGTGKSTLLEALAVCSGFNAEGGTRNFDFSTAETHSKLCDYLTVIKGIKHPRDGYFLRAESFYNVASNIDELDKIPAAAPKISASYGGKSLHNQSHGESFLTLVEHRFGGNGLYILDEPEAALSPKSQMKLLAEIDRLVGKNSQFIIATHSPVLLAFPNAEIFVLSGDAITLTPYKETVHYTMTKNFLDNPDRMIKYLLEK